MKLTYIFLLAAPLLGGAFANFPLRAQNAKSTRVIHVPADHTNIQAAIDAARDGDTVLVAPGVYRGSLKINGKTITLASQFHTSRDQKHVARTILDGQREDGKQGTILSVEAGAGPNTRLIGFTIQNADHAVIVRGQLQALHNHFTGNKDALSFEDGQGVVRFNVFENDRDDGIDMDGASAAIVEDNIIRNNKDDGIEIRLHKYQGETLHTAIRRNVFEGNREDGIQLIDYPDKSSRSILIERNLFVKNAMAAIGCMSDGATKENYAGAAMPEPVVVVNNTFVGSYYGITGGDNMVLLNNLIVGTAKVALKRINGDSAAGPNLLWNNAADTEDCDLNPDVFVSKDPLLDRDHKPRPGSPCIDAGTASFKFNGETLTLPADSYAGEAPDFGASEFIAPKTPAGA